jgi:hypothetical protein
LKAAKKLTSSEKKKKKKSAISVEVGGNLDDKKHTFNELKLSNELNILVLDVEKTKI